MPPKTRVICAALLGLMTAAALGRAQLGGDTEASILSAPGFFAALLPALAVGWVGSPVFGRAAPLALLLSVLVVGVAFAAGAAGAVLTGMAQAEDLGQLPRQPLAWGSLLGAVLLPQLYAFAQARSEARSDARSEARAQKRDTTPDQSRK